MGRVDVCGRDEAVRLDGDLDHDCFAVGVARGGEEGDALAGDRAVDGVACADHSVPPSVPSLTPRMLRPEAPKIVGRAVDFASAARAILRRRASSAGRTTYRPAG